MFRFTLIGLVDRWGYNMEEVGVEYVGFCF